MEAALEHPNPASTRVGQAAPSVEQAVLELADVLEPPTEVTVAVSQLRVVIEQAGGDVRHSCTEALSLGIERWPREHNVVENTGIVGNTDRRARVQGGANAVATKGLPSD